MFTFGFQQYLKNPVIYLLIMRKYFFLIVVLLVLILPVLALRVENTGIPAFDFSAYSDTIAYENDEGLYSYNLKNKESYFIAKGSNPSVYGFIIAFDSSEEEINKDVNLDEDFNDRVIRYFNIKEKKVYDTDFVGQNPSIHGNTIVFDVFEKDVAMDLNKDEDTEDHVIHIYDIELKTINNTEIVGMNAFAGLKLAVFETDEKEYGNDLNGDAKTNDKIIRVLLFEDFSLINTAIPGEAPSVYKDKMLVFTANEVLVKKDVNEDGDLDDLFPVILTLPDLNKVDVSLSGAFPSVFKDIVVFVENNKLMGYSKITDSWFLNDLYCSNPVLFEDFAVVLTHEKLEGDLNEDRSTKDSVLRVFYFEDLDNDSVSDVVDNCPRDANPDQVDVDADGLGDVCDDEIEVVEEEVVANISDIIEESDEEDVKLDLPQEKEYQKRGSFLKTLLFIVLLLLLVVIFVKVLPSYLERRRKGFGF